MRPAALIGFAAAALLLGGLVVGYFVAIPTLSASPLLDANLARALTAPLGQRLADLAVVFSVVLALAAPRWIASKAGTTIALVLTAAALAHRLLLVPHLDRLWARVDVVAARPVDLLAEAQRWSDHQQWLLLAMCVLVLALFGLASRRTV
ncbi:hypothetical protein OV203_27220 [Nannocystis sp. ILAH1]|uniref:hypothetical protein n=1 Tax=unclassified Nannocystis TaxID=2627009 RepID=UPI00226E6C0B|nr:MULTISPECIES: hypothetical protein [unclassified Nannocystis]MCY0990865.1 hypothetical protein [Nannocystis sp. ILAH1]MCY1072394.1 hypothetical protein [Nannocystis sp. RBIL2]